MTKNLVKIDIYLSGIRGGGMAVSVRIEIRGLQRADAKEEWAENKTVAVGICRKHGDGYAVIYEERTEAGTVRTKLQLEKDRLCICRSGVIGASPGFWRNARRALPNALRNDCSSSSDK